MNGFPRNSRITRFGAALLLGLLCLAFSSPVFAAQYARPDSTIATGSYLPINASSLHEAVDEITASDTDYMQSPESDSTVELGLSDVTDPGTDSGHIMRVRLQKTHNAAVATFELYQGSTPIRSQGITFTDKQIWESFSFTLTTGEAGSITDYSDLRFRVVGSGLRSGRTLWVSWMELEVPDPLALTEPTVTSPTFTDVTSTTATLGGNVTDDGGSTVTSRGVEWGTSPGVYGTSVPAAAGGTGIFTTSVTGLPSGTVIYFRAWATNTTGTGVSSESSFTTLPVASAPTHADITQTTVTLGGTVSSDGTAPVSARGTVWGTAPNPTGNSLAEGGTTNGTFTHGRTGLPSGTLIYYRAYASNAGGTSYSADNTFTTQAYANTPTSTVLSDTSAQLGGTITSDGGQVTDRGTVWGTAPAPTGNALSEGTGNGTFTHTRTGLPVGTLVYFRAYATTNGGTTYSADGTFTTFPSVTLPSFANVTDTAADLGGTVTSVETVTNKGVEWGTSSGVYPNNVSTGTGGTGAFTTPVTGLPPGTTIYFRAWATNAGGTGYSVENSFTTDAGIPTVDSPTFADVTDTTATLGGNVTGDGGGTVSDRGVEWGTSSGNYPNDVPTGTGGTGVFTTPVTGLPAGTVIYFRAWALNESGRGYSSESSFTTLPTVSAPSFANVTDTTADLGGTVTSAVAILDKGVEWGTSPGTYPNNVPTGSGGTGAFTTPVTGLPANTLIYFRAWGTNSAGTSYSGESSFTTDPGAPTVESPTFANVTDTSATLGGDITSDGGGTVSDKGVEWGTSPGTYPNNLPTGTGGTGVFTVPVSPLPSGTLIYFRAWATNETDTAYSSESSFTTLPTVSAPTFTGVTDTTATLGGTVSSDGAATVTERGTVWGTAPSPTGNALAEGSGNGTFTHERTGLPADTLIYFRAYAINAGGTSYSDDGSFTTENAAAVPTVTTPTVATVTASTATLGGNVTDDGGDTITERGTVWALTADPVVETDNKNIVAGTTGIFTGPVTGLNNATQINYRAYATNGEGTGYTGNDTFWTEPLNSPASVTIDTVTASSFRITWPAASGNNGDAAIVVVKADSVVTAVPTDGVEHAFDATFGSGADLGTLEYVVYRGTATEVTVGGLAELTTYHVAVFYSAGSGTGTSGINYRQSTPATNSDTTIAATNEPSVQASNIVVEVISLRSLRFSWTEGNGEGSLATVRLQPTAESAPVDFTDYVADPDFTIGPETSGGSGNIVVYKGTGSSVTVSGLAADTNYTLTVYAWGGTGAETDYLTVNPATADQITNGPAMHNYDNAADCGDCHSNHGNAGLVPRGTNQEDVCVTCHQATGPASDKVDFGLHLTPGYGDVDPDCGSCHEVHRINVDSANTTESYDPDTTTTAHNLTFIRANVDKYIATATPDDAVHHVAVNSQATEGGDATTSRGICQACHTLTSYHTHNSADENSQCHKGGAADTCDGGEVNCTSCHTHTGNFGASGGSCTGCHNSAQNGGPPTGRRAVVGEFTLLSHHVTGTLAESDCEVCHAQSGAGAITHSHMDGEVTLWNVDDHGANAFQLNDHADPFTNTTEAAKLSQFCLNCHDSNGAAAETAPLAPFSGSGAPPVIDSTHWSNSSHNTGGAASPVTCFGDGTGGCHASGHGSNKQWLLAPYTVAATDPDRSEEREEFCFECHDSDGMSTLDIQADFAGSAIIGTSASTALINNRHDVMPADQSRSGGEVTCKFCHDQHKNTDADPVADLPTDTDTSLPDYSPSSRYQKDTYDFAYGPNPSQDPTNPEFATGGPYTEPDYIQFCLTCHDGNMNGLGTMSPNMINMAEAYQTDQHGAGSADQGNKGELKPPFGNAVDDRPTANAYQALNCTTCHGAHGTGNIYNLRTSITVAGTQMEIGSVTGSAGFSNLSGTYYELPSPQTDHLWGAWCTFCHELSGHRNYTEATTCTGAHMHGESNF